MEAAVVLAGGFEQRVGADDVGVEERPRVVERVFVVGLGGVVHDGVDAREELVHGAHPSLCEAEPGEAEPCEAEPGEPARDEAASRYGMVACTRSFTVSATNAVLVER